MNHLFDALIPSGRSGGQVCLIREDGRVLTYADLDAHSRRYAAALHAVGVVPGDRVLVQVEKSPEALFLYLACLRAGAVFLPLNSAYTATEVEYFFNDAAASLIVCGQDHESVYRKMAGGRARVLTLDADADGSLPRLAEEERDGWVDVVRGPQDLAAILYTSGTTGRSKGAMLSHGNLRANAEALIEAWHYRSEDVLVHALPIFHAHGLYVGVNVTLMAGASMIFLPRFDPAQVMDRLGRATVMMGVPTYYTRLLDQPGLSREAAEGMRVFISGSAPLPVSVHKAFLQRTGHAIIERYGMTETGMLASNPYEGARVPGSVGQPLRNVHIRIAHAETGEVLGRDDIGSIEVKGPNVFSGYWGMPEKTKTEFRPDGFFITGDIGKIDGDGYVWILGRSKDVVITGGYNVYPKEVEEELERLPDLEEAAVIGLAHRDLGEAVVAIVVPKADFKLEERELIDSLRNRLAGYKLPKRVLLAHELPRNTMGKIQKNLLREQYADLFLALSDATGGR